MSLPPSRGGWSFLTASTDAAQLSCDSVADADCARAATLDEFGPLLVDPIDHAPLRRSGESDEVGWRLLHGRPDLLPRFLSERIIGEQVAVTLADAADSRLQYVLLNLVRNAGGNHNSAPDDPWYRRHLHRSRRLLETATGFIVDVGCDEPSVSRRLFPPGVRYLGLDPGLGRRRETCLLAMAEFLPFRSESVDGVAFLTSLDHILDYHAALDEAYRVLRPGGRLYIASLVWTHRAELIRDGIHFHHFRQHELEGALAAFDIESLTRYDWKNDSHRFGVYLVARKRAADDPTPL